MTTPTARAPEGRINYAETLDFPTKRIILFGVLLGLFLAALDQTIVSTALPIIVQELDGLSLYSWVTTAYLLASTAMVPIYGKLSDIYGRKPILLFGIVVFLVGSALCGMAGEPWFGNLFGGGMMQLVVFRGLQGLGAAALTSVAFAIIADLFAPADRGRYQGLFGAVFGLSSVIGPLLGGFLTDNISWRWVFYVNLPVGLLAIAFILSKMPTLASGLKPKVDYLGAALIVAFSVPLLLALTFGADQAAYGWQSPTVWTLFAVSAAALVAFLFAESRHESPILPLTLFRNPTFAWSVTARFFIGAAFLGAILFLSLYLVNVQGVSATKAGTATIPLTVGLIIGAIGSGQIASRIGRYKPLMLIGLTTMILGFLLLSTLNADTPYWAVIARMVVLGLGIGPALPLYNLALQNAVQPWEIGVATSAGQFFQQFGSVIGTAVFGALLSSGLSSQFSTQFRAAQTGQPAAVVSQLETIRETAASSSGGQGQSQAQPSAAEIEAQIKKGFATQRDLTTRAIQNGDAAAIAQLTQSPNTPAAFKEQFAQGSIQAGFARTYAAVEQAVNSGNAQAVAALAQNPQLPAPLRAQLSQIPAPALANPQSRSQILAGVKQGLDAAQTQTVQQALRGALSGLDTAEQSALSTAKTVGTLASRAVKVSFANTISRIYLWSILVAALALLATLPMPNLILPRRGEGQPQAPVPVEV
ncbi:MDR family MFS transporter [Deinococcus koreensis]|uniref:MFS transporter n=1 Tax=Deinococcus koreensis TaxID=2054903 RepID=A0A2K3V1E2_9DEIO|nr:MDR family MFS transporter [Deinococcus koreensis]PNY82605.1 MFS transporter [Deinococcus koreensis]